MSPATPFDPLFSAITAANVDVHAARIRQASEDASLLSRTDIQQTITAVLRSLEAGTLRVASPKGSGAFSETWADTPMVGDMREWDVHAWVKQAVLLALRWRVARPMGATAMPQSLGGELSQFNASGGGAASLFAHAQGRLHGSGLTYFDKLEVRSDLGEKGVRVVPPGAVREGAFLAPGCIVMPGYVNVGAWVGRGTMVDTWATVGSCAQIGRGVHLAGGVGIGGVLEPAGARPVLVGDDAFIGSRAIVVEGAVIGNGAVLGANVCLTSSTPIYDVTTVAKMEHRGYVPPGAVVAPGTRPKSFPGGEVQLQCAYIIAWRNEKTDAKVSLNDVLRETGISV